VEVAAARDAGLVSAQDSAGHSGLGTVPAGRPSRRVDWVFGTPDVSFSGFALPAAGVSDHLPLAVTVRLG
jgi:endonuclease/exonuclease/phosphatase family metal-dependent hydrolase